MEKRILLVDDNTELLEIMMQRLNSWGYWVATASGGKEALSFLEDNKADVIILDYLMPEMDGVSVLKKIRRRDSKTPVIMFTAHPNSASIKGVELLGVSSFIPKVSAYTDVAASLKTALELAFKNLIRKEKE